MGPEINGLVVNLEATFGNLPKALIVDSVATLNVFIIPHPSWYVIQQSIASGFHWELEIVLRLKSHVLLVLAT